LRYFVNEEGGVEMARDGVRGKKSTDLVVYVINEATKLLKGTSVPTVLHCVGHGGAPAKPVHRAWCCKAINYL